jgi:hypothetical protein
MCVRKYPQSETPFTHRSGKDLDLCTLRDYFIPEGDFSCRDAAPHQRIDWATKHALCFEYIQATVFEAEAARGKPHFTWQLHTDIGQSRLASGWDARNPEPKKDRRRRPEMLGTEGRIKACGLCSQSTPAQACREKGRYADG